ncbi:MAG TPA: HAMP domain-containing sensor histidine kinase [bacterium]|nr:HAMP domain-containing sensor histidine kinase [bacterium]
MGSAAARLLASSGFLPHGYCISWEPRLLMLMVGSDSLTTLAYYSIPLTLLYFVYRRRQTGYNWVVVLFAVFILACGTTHLMDVVTLWIPAYWTQGVIKAATAVVSVLTAMLLWPLVPKVLALPTPTQLQFANDQLRAEIGVRLRAEAELLSLQSQLEEKVLARTAELENAKVELQREVLERRRIDRFKDELVAMVSHELRTPLTSIGGALQVLTTEENVSQEDKRELADIALRNTDRMMRLVNSLLDIDRIESGRMEFSAGSVSLVSLAQVAIGEYQVFAQQHRTRLVLTEAREVGPVRGDADRLMQVLTNLISNAVKHAPPDSAVELAVSMVEDRVRVAVTDHGPGVPAEYRERVFEKFVQVPRSPAHPSEGIGLGLSIARAIVQRHGGHMGLDSPPGAGCTVYFEVPLHAHQRMLEQSEEGRLAGAGRDPLSN